MGENPEKPSKGITPMGKFLIGLGVVGTIGMLGSMISSPSTANTAVKNPAIETPQVAAAKVETKQEAVTEPVAYTTKTMDDASLAKGSTKVAQEGKDGIKTLTYEVTYTDGQESGRTLISDEITTKPTDKVIHNGTYVAPPPKPKPVSSCDPNYSGCVPKVSYDLDCPDIGFSVTVLGSDIHRFDRDGDGYGCESY